MPGDLHAAVAGRRIERGARLLSDNQWRTIARSLHLSNRELQVVQSVFEDCKEASIARDLGISPYTVHSHLERLYKKLGVGSRCGLIVRIFAEYIALETAGGDGELRGPRRRRTPR